MAENDLIGLYYTAHTLTQNNEQIRKRSYLHIEVAAIIVGLEDAEEDIYSKDLTILKRIEKIVNDTGIYWSTLDKDYFEIILQRLSVKKNAKFALTRLELFEIIQEARIKNKEDELILSMIDIGMFHKEKIGNLCEKAFLSNMKNKEESWWKKITNQ